MGKKLENPSSRRIKRKEKHASFANKLQGEIQKLSVSPNVWKKFCEIHRSVAGKYYEIP